MLGANSLLLRGAARALRAVKTDGGARASEADSGPADTNAPQDERSITTMRTTRILMLSLLAVFAFSAVAATGAQADPWWIVKCHKVTVAKTGEWKNSTCTEAEAKGEYTKRLLAGETRATKSKQNSGTSGVFKLKASLLAVECKSETQLKGELIGGNPGTDTSEVEFKECSVEKKSVAECGAATAGKGAGVIGPFKVRTLLGFPEGKAPNKEEAYDQLFPGGETETEFTSFKLTGSSCGTTLENNEVKVVATGTKAAAVEYENAKHEKIKPLCGVIARVGKIEEPEEKFKVTKSGEEYEAGGLEFPLKKAKAEYTKEEVWNPTTKTFEKVRCGLEAVTTKTGKLEAEEVGVALVETVPAEPFGWEE
jgi:hypothetical protein